MRRSVIETLLGAVVIVVALVFLMFSYKTANVSAGRGGYDIVANFSEIGGLNAGDNVEISGVKIGRVTSVSLDPETFLARVHMNVDDSVKLSTDTAAIISSESLLGGRYLSLQPGSDEELLEPGGVIQFTQAPQNLEQLLGKFIFSATESKDKEESEEAHEASAATAVSPAPVSAPAPTPVPAEAAPAPSAAAEVATPSAPTPQPVDTPDGQDESAAPAPAQP